MLIRIREVCRLTGLSRTSIWRLERRGEFPHRVRIGPNAVAWCLAEIEAWISEKLASRISVTAKNERSAGNVA